MRARVALGVALPIFIVLASLSIFNYFRQYKMLDEQSRLDAIQLGDMMIHSLNHAMLSKEGEHLISSLGDLSQLESVQLIQVIGISGKVLADSSDIVTERILKITDPECQTCHQYPVSERPRVIPFVQPSKGWRISAPVDNLPQCHSCHDPSLDHLGVLLMDISLNSKQEHLLEDLQINLLISVISTGLVTLMSYILMHRLVVRRVEALQQPLADYSGGDFKKRISLDTSLNDELCELADTFNRMADQLEMHAQAAEELQQLRERAIVEERERIARELHDGFAQVLGYVNTKVMAVRLLVKDKKLKEADIQLMNLENAARGLFIDVREAILGLKISGRVQGGLFEALELYINEFTRLSGVPISFETSVKKIEKGSLPAETELHLFKIVQEALNNVRKHAMASQAWVKFFQQNGNLILEIQDNGVGLENIPSFSNDIERLGLNNMQERAKEIGAQFIINSKNGEGTRVVVKIAINGEMQKL